MNLSNAVFNFATGLVSAATAGTPLKNAIAHADTYEEMNGAGGTKYVRVDDLLGSVPQPVAPNVLKEFNVVLDVQFLQIPVSQKLADRLAAREVVDQMALAFIKAIYGDQRLGTNDCNIIGDCSVKKLNDWRKVANVKTPISIVRLSMNKI
jgi:hypothetical protein